MFFESISQALKYIVECYRMVTEEPKLLLPSLLSVVVGAFVGIVVMIASLLFGIFGFIGFLISILIALGLFALLSGFNVFFGIAVAVIFAFTAISLVTTLNQFVRTSFYTLIYAWAEERLEHCGPTIVAPTPLKHAFGI